MYPIESLKRIQAGFTDNPGHTEAVVAANLKKGKEKTALRILATIVISILVALLPVIVQTLYPGVASAALVSCASALLLLLAGYWGIQACAGFNVFNNAEGLYDDLETAGLVFEYSALMTTYGLRIPNRKLLRLDYLIARADAAEIEAKIASAKEAGEPSVRSSPVAISREYLDSLKSMQHAPAASEKATS